MGFYVGRRVKGDFVPETGGWARFRAAQAKERPYRSSMLRRQNLYVQWIK